MLNLQKKVNKYWREMLQEEREKKTVEKADDANESNKKPT